MSIAIVCAKILVYFSMRTNFFYFTYLLFKTSYIILSILQYISLKYQFFYFSNYFFSSYIITTIHSLHPLFYLLLRYVKKE